MELGDIEKITVLGAGTMGHGITEVAALAGYSVVLRDIEESLVEDGMASIEWSLDKLVEHDRISSEHAETTLERITPVVDLERALESTDLVIEAVPEKMEIKREVFDEVSTYAPDHTIFTTNTSSLSISEIASATDRPERFCGMHFFHPPVRMDLVEVIAGEQTDEETMNVVVSLAEALEKTPVRVEHDSPGFIVNRILVPVLNEAAWMLHHDEAAIAEIDSTATYLLGLPMGTFELADYVGLDVCLFVLEYIHEELGDAYEPCPVIQELVEAGKVGQKADHGFYSYEDGGVSIPTDAGAGWIADRLVAIMANEVAKLRSAEVADLESIDTAVRLGLGFPDGPARMADERGLATLIETLETRAEATGHDRYGVDPALRNAAERGGYYPDNDDASNGDFEELRIEYPAPHVGAIVLDRPHRLNAITQTLLQELPQAIDQLESDDTRVILLRGAGDRAFSAGADIGAMAGVLHDSDDAISLSRTGQSAFGRLQHSDMVVIAAIDGYCLGGGMELATAADLRIASDRSTFGQTEFNLGLLPGWGGTQRLGRVIGEARAKEIIFTADHYDAETLAEYGFLNRVVDADNFREAAESWAEELARGPPIAQQLTKRAMLAGRDGERAGLSFESLAFGQLTQTEDLMEGVSAFMEDRDPEFTGE